VDGEHVSLRLEAPLVRGVGGWELGHLLRAGESFNALRLGPLAVSEVFSADARPWGAVKEFFSACISGNVDAEEALGLDRSPLPTTVAPRTRVENDGRRTFALEMAYDGSFDGSFDVGGEVATVERALQSALAPLVRDDNHKLAVAGRTDRGVSALGKQVVSFYTKADISEEEVMEAINSSAPSTRLRCVRCERIGRSFHAAYSCNARRYVYVLPLLAPAGARGAHVTFAGPSPQLSADFSDLGLAAHLDRLLRALEGRSVDMFAFARRTPQGKSSICTFLRARARSTTLPCGTAVVAIELCANRFLRRLCRVIVATAVREALAAAAAGEEAEATVPTEQLLLLAATGNRDATAGSAPPEGLALVSAHYEDDPLPLSTQAPDEA